LFIGIDIRFFAKGHKEVNQEDRRYHLSKKKSTRKTGETIGEKEVNQEDRRDHLKKKKSTRKTGETI
jgi:hypothetical protein